MEDGAGPDVREGGQDALVVLGRLGAVQGHVDGGSGEGTGQRKPGEGGKGGGESEFTPPPFGRRFLLGVFAIVMKTGAMVVWQF